MKKLLIITGLVFSSLVLNGCYTKVMWDSDRPSESSKYTSDYEVSHEYYKREYYGGYSNYYSSSWWASLPTSNGKSTVKGKPGEKGESVETVREGSGGRGLNVRIDAAPATRSGSSGSGSAASTSSSTTSSTSETRPAGSSTDKKAARSDDGGRATNKEKK